MSKSNMKIGVIGTSGNIELLPMPENTECSFRTYHDKLHKNNDKCPFCEGSIEFKTAYTLEEVAREVSKLKTREPIVIDSIDALSYSARVKFNK
ncbi:hypothetical protein SP15_221 [Bacillus phage SP-15]|uniref:Uncharacterized protein n=1 Tax=Bacillus phage SP-15 TaxID=1792032 RepID=A0A127AWQ8_9CAUD|nr:hypothetical protein SP15_221 [Bacillus phage SP-15]AMM45022.1 hypothetical protein SP15_221 [Bacillus phage SP-15]